MKKIIVAALALALMSGSAYAAGWNFYGQAKIWTGWANKDLIDEDEGDDPSYDTQYSEGLYADAVVGANVTVSDELSARFEYGTADGKADVRHLYGVWNFGSGTLTVGKTVTPIAVTYSNQMVPDNGEDGEALGLGGFGDFDNNENAEVMLTFGGFSIAIIAPEKNAWVLAGEDGPILTNDGINAALDLVSDTVGVDVEDLLGMDIGYDTQAVIPMIAIGYKATFDMGEVQIAGGYNTVEINNDEDIDSYAVGLGTQLNFGAVGVFATFVWGENIANLGTATATAYNGQAYYESNIFGGEDGEVYDCQSIGGTIGLTFAVNDMLALEAGYGYIHDDYDEDDVSTSIAQSYYLQAAITLAPGVTITPEVGMIDQREPGLEENVYFGAAWAIAF